MLSFTLITTLDKRGSISTSIFPPHPPHHLSNNNHGNLDQHVSAVVHRREEARARVAAENAANNAIADANAAENPTLMASDSSDTAVQGDKLPATENLNEPAEPGSSCRTICSERRCCRS